jgi:hypothetical protein
VAFCDANLSPKLLSAAELGAYIDGMTNQPVATFHGYCRIADEFRTPVHAAQLVVSFKSDPRNTPIKCCHACQQSFDWNSLLNVLEVLA